MLFQQANTMTGTSTACTLLINPHFPDSHCNGRKNRSGENIAKVGICSLQMQHMGLADSEAETIETATIGGEAARRYHCASIGRDWRRYGTQWQRTFVHIQQATIINGRFIADVSLTEIFTRLTRLSRSHAHTVAEWQINSSYFCKSIHFSRCNNVLSLTLKGFWLLQNAKNATGVA